jgi:hypothetical protein
MEAKYGDELDEIRDMVGQIQEDQAWLSDIEIKAAEATEGKPVMTFSWQIKDYTEGSEVRFHYRKSGEEAFQQLTANTMSTGSFEVQLELEAETQPQWFIDTRYDGKDNQIAGKVETNSYTLEYYISVDNGNRVISSSIERTNLQKIITIYSGIETNVEINKNNLPHRIKFYWDEDKYRPEKVALEVYNGSSVVKEELKTKDERNEVVWQPSTKSFSKLVAIVQYEDGKTFQKEIWNENQ